MKALSKLLLIVLLLTSYTAGQAQETVEMADKMRADGKIYVVVSIILVILFGFISYLFILDRKISKLENQIGNNSVKTK